MSEIAYIGIGSNLSAPRERCLEAIERLASQEEISGVKRSALYETEPVGGVAQDWFVNAVIKAKEDPAVREALLRGDYESAAKRGIRARELELSNAVSTWALSSTGAEVKAHRYITERWPRVGAAIARPGDEGLYWRLDRWLVSRGYDGVKDGLLNITQEEQDELYLLALIAVPEEWEAAGKYLEGTDER